ncbi:hypothetical protein [Microvirga makkahensis]|uniref:Flagellar FliJ protein n=1 Tax=Microvirga makkahensis TaxID=1128670 RepID=A0A7X3MRF6_9HYPH|nr:hypothetical protein [Microvirga makkahensis]MXQ11683.1 hypothetical protein [Microvirga makkahensis]
MRERLKKVDRLVNVQRQLHRNAELQLVSLEHREAELKTAQEELLQAMGDTDALHGLFVDVIAKRVKMLALEEAKTRAAIVDQRAVTVAKALQVKRSEKLFSRVKEDVRQSQEKTDLNAILEAIVGRGSTSLP